MNKEKLLKLADFLDTVPANRFDFGVWTSHDWNPETHSCGTTACALGWAASMPEFQAEGLRFMEGTGVDGTKYPFMRYRDRLGAHNAGRAFFGLDSFQFEYLFIPDADNGMPISAGPQCLASHIRRFVERDGVLE